MFKTYNLHERVLKAIEQLQFTTPTPVQQKAIPAVLEGRDVISLAKTGSGKTLAYLAPVLTHILENQTKPGSENAQANSGKFEKAVLILVPTRELATQVGNVVADLTRHTAGINSAVVIGGANMGLQFKKLRSKPNIIVATPGRFIDHVRQKTVDLAKVTHLVLDEADRMFDMGFAPQVNEIVKRLPSNRQTMLFSATFPKEIRSLANQVLKNPLEIEVRSDDRPPAEITQKTIELSHTEKNEKTLDLINAAKGSVVIFTRTKSRTDRLFKYLDEYGVRVARIHGDRSQGQRTRSIEDFKSGVVNVLVATDIAARGLDVPSISDVINYDIPMTAEDYVHRIGRTGRAGSTGQSLTLITPEDRNNWNYIARKVGLGQLEKAKGGSRPQQSSHDQKHRPQQHQAKGRSHQSREHQGKKNSGRSHSNNNHHRGKAKFNSQRSGQQQQSSW